MKYIFIPFIAFTIACVSENQETNEEKMPEYRLARAPDQWIENRVAIAKDRLTKSEAGTKIWEAIETHGGLSRWFANGPIGFYFDYQSVNTGNRTNSYQVVDQWSVRAVHRTGKDRTIRYGWSGSEAWSHPDTVDIDINPRFWSTTPFYFIALPFVLADNGVILEKLTPKEYKGIMYDVVKASYETGIGDAPDDYYIIYIHPQTKRMEGLRYIVSYPGFFPDGGHTPEKFMEISGYQTIDGIMLPTGYHTYRFEDNEPTELITKVNVTEVSFKPDLEKTYFDVPAGARVQEGLK